jgi:methionine-gamma-lyase
MAARTACLLDAAADGQPHVVAIRALYGTTDHLLSSGLLGTQVNGAATPDEDAAGSAATPDW